MSTRVQDSSGTEKPRRAGTRQRGQSVTKNPSQRLRQLAKARLNDLSASEANLIDQVKRGFPFHKMESLAGNLGMTTNRLGEDFLNISRATLTRRRQSGQLNPGESDKVVRYARLLRLATDLMEGDEEAARRWLSTPLPVLNNEPPLEYARTETGAHELEQLVGRLEHGVYS